MPTQRLVTDFFNSRVSDNSSMDEETAAILTPTSAADGSTNAQEPKRWAKRQRASKSQESSVRGNTAKPVTRSAWLTSHPQADLSEKVFPGSGDESRRASRSGSLVVDPMSQSILRCFKSAPNIMLNIMS